MHSVGILVVACMAFQATFAASVAKDYCSKPVIAENLDTEWIQNHYTQEWHLPTGNTDARKHLSQILQGTTLSDSADFSNMCARLSVNFTDGNIGGKYRGYGDKSADWNCQFEGDKIVCNYFTNPNKEYTEKAQAYISYFDGKQDHNVFVAVICFGNGDVGWFAASLTKQLSSEESVAVSDHVKSLGFNSDSQVPLYTAKC